MATIFRGDKEKDIPEDLQRFKIGFLLYALRLFPARPANMPTFGRLLKNDAQTSPYSVLAELVSHV